MASPLPTCTVILTMTDGTKTGVVEERTFTGINQNQLDAWSQKKVWTQYAGLYWVQIFQEN